MAKRVESRTDGSGTLDADAPATAIADPVLVDKPEQEPPATSTIGDAA